MSRILISTLLFILQLIQSRADIYEEQLINKLLNNYNIYARAGDSFYNVTDVTVSLTLNQILEVDEKNQIITTYCWLLMVWNDPRLGWNESDYNGIDEVHVGSDRIWKPDIILYNSAEKESYSNELTNMVITSNGDVQWWIDTIFRSSCEINIEYFPYDIQNCTLMFSSWNYDITKIDSLAGTVDKSNFKQNSEFILRDLTVIRHVTKYDCCEYPYAEINFYIVIERRPFFYVFNMMIPCVLITVVSFIGFFMPASSGEKISVGITTLLSISVLLLVISADMPISDSIPLLGRFYGAAMIIVSLVTGATVFTLNIHHKGEEEQPIPPKIKKIFFSKFGRIIMFPFKIEIENDNPNRETNLNAFNSKSSLITNTTAFELNNEKTNSINLVKDHDDIARVELPIRTLSINTRKRVANRVEVTENDDKSSYNSLSITASHSVLPTVVKEKQECVQMQWSLLSAIIDRMLFYIFTIVTVVVMTVIVYQAPNAKM